MQVGKFITFEGTEGVGKTTAIEGLCQHLQKVGIDYICTREPGGSEFGEQLRALLLDPSTDISDDTELLLMFAARSDHLSQTIMPALQSGKWVICDRFIDSSVAYQGYGRGYADSNIIHKVEMLITNFVAQLPDMTLWLDLPIYQGMARATKRSQADRFEQEEVAFFERVHQGFMNQYAAYPDRIHRIDAGGDIHDVSARVWQAVYDAFLAI